MLKALQCCQTLGSYFPAPALSVARTVAPYATRGFAATDPPVSFCIVGCGPAGFYTADKLLKSFGARAKIDLLDRLPTPFGLVRSGVAPDHQSTKNVQNHFTDIGRDPRVAFFGNVELGKDVSLDQLWQTYDSVVLAYGAESDRKLGVAGEVGARNVFSAREFVWWYNGHPDAKSLPLDLSNVKSVVVCGIGNVALDCARVVLQPTDRLASTDVASHTVHGLQSANGGAGIKHVHLVARRGVAQAACTPKELKELTTEFNLIVHALPEHLHLSERDQEEMKSVRMKRRVVDLITKAASKEGPSSDDARHLHFHFNRNPVEIMLDPASKAVTGVRVEKTRQEMDSSGRTIAVGTGEHETIPAELVLVSIGYKSLPVSGLPAFDASRGVVPNVKGRVLSRVDGNNREQCAETVPRLYVVGWLKRGPSGIIGSNLVDAEETVECIVADQIAESDGRAGREGLLAILREKQVPFVSFDDWLKLDAMEVGAGKKAGKVREKFVDVDVMLQVCQGGQKQ